MKSILVHVFPIHLSSRTYFRLLPVDSTQPLLSLCVCVVLLSFIVFSTWQCRKREAAWSDLWLSYICLSTFFNPSPKWKVKMITQETNPVYWAYTHCLTLEPWNFGSFNVKDWQTNKKITFFSKYMVEMKVEKDNCHKAPVLSNGCKPYTLG